MSARLDEPTPIVAGDVVRGVTRLLYQQGWMALNEVALPNGRRADIIALGPKGQIRIVEVKVARSDLVGDAKWPEYLPWCDEFFWAISATLDPDWIPVMDGCDGCGLMVADRYDAAIVRDAALRPLPVARRKSEWLRLTRIAMHRIMLAGDPDLRAIETSF